MARATKLKSSPATGRKRRRLYLPHALQQTTGAIVPLRPEQKRHLITTLRHGAGDEVAWFDGSGGVGLGILRGSERTEFGIELMTRTEMAVEPSDHCVLVLALPRRESMHQCIELATIAGVGTIQLVQGAHSAWKLAANGRAAFIGKATSIAIDAAEQSGRLTVPRISWLDEVPGGEDHAVVACAVEETIGAESRGDFPDPGSPLRLAIGPEGGWSTGELADFGAAGWSAWHIPGATLTTVAACAILPALWRFGNQRD